MAHDIIEHNGELNQVVVIGLQTGGIGFATRIAQVLADVSGTPVATVGRGPGGRQWVGAAARGKPGHGALPCMRRQGVF